jgi:hypothetical protein
MATRSSHVARILSVVMLFSVQAWGFAAQKGPEKPRHIPRTVWNFDGGVFLETDGSLNDNTCFRLAGRLMAKDFFEGLKRVDDDHGTTYLRGKETLTQFPEQLKLLFVIHDLPCSAQLRGAPGREYLTREMMGKLQLALFWKHGVDLRPADNFKLAFFSVNPIAPYAQELVKDLPERMQWAYELEIPSAGVPLSDSLVLVLRRADGRIAARVAARL